MKIWKKQSAMTFSLAGLHGRLVPFLSTQLFSSFESDLVGHSERLRMTGGSESSINPT